MHGETVQKKNLK